MRIVESLHMTTTFEDWSRVRSPSRARRRLRQGHPQNIVVRQVPRKDAITLDGGITYHMHPETARALRAMLPEAPPPSLGGILVRHMPLYEMVGNT